MTDKKRIFISYGRGDVNPDKKSDADFYPIVEKIANHLNMLEPQTGRKAWYDKFDMPSVLEFTDEIGLAIEQSEYLLLFIGDHALKSEFCRREWMHAIRNCVPIIPILLKGKWDDDLLVKTLPPSIRNTNGIDATAMSEDKLLSEIVRLTGIIPKPLITPQGANKPPIYVIDRPQYTIPIKKKLGVGDPTNPHRQNVVSITSEQEVAAFMGIGGIGKTTLALIVCNDCDVRRSFDQIFFLDVNQGDVEQLLLRLFSQLGAYLGDNVDSDAYKNWRTARGLVQSKLSHKRTLIILDDVWDDGIIEHFNFAGVDCRLLITTRNKALVDDPQSVSRLSNDEGLELLARFYDPLNPDITALTDAHKGIVAYLNGYTLAIEIAGRWMKKYKQKTPAEYLALLQSDTAKLFDNLQVGKDKNVNLEKSLALSYHFLESDDDRARFRALGIFPPNVNYTGAALDAIWGLDDGFKQATALIEVGLLDYDETRNRYNQHPLLRAYALKLLTDANENEAVFGRYADFYTGRAKEIFSDTPIQDWADKEGGANFDDVMNIKALGAELMRQTQNGTTGDLARANAFAYATSRYVNYRLEERVWAWTEMGISAVRHSQKDAPDDQSLKERLALFLNNMGGVYSALGDKQKALGYYEGALPIMREVGDRGGEATTLNNMGSVYQSIGKMNEALAKYEEALPIMREVGDRGGEATTLNNMGSVYQSIGKMNEALAKYEEALPIVRAVGDRGGEATTLNNMGSVYQSIGKMNEALAKYEEALPIMREVGNRGGEATTLNNMGIVYQSIGKMNEALAKYEEALPIMREVGDRGGEATTLNNMGIVYKSIGKMNEALAKYEEALPIYREVGDRRGEATTLNNMGSVYESIGKMNEALAKYEEALPIRREVGDRGGEAATLNNMGIVYDALGDKQKALVYYEQALPIVREVGDRGGEATTLNNMGSVYDALGDKQKALAYFEQALPIHRAVGDRAGEAVALNKIGGVYHALGELQKALAYYEQALWIHRAVGDRAGEAVALNKIGGVYHASGELQKALAKYEEALPITREVGDRGGEAKTLNNMGGVYDALGDKQKALVYYEQALPIMREVGDRGGEATTLNNMGGVYDALGDKQKALVYYEQALTIRREVGDKSGEAVTCFNIGMIYHELGDLDKAIEYVERCVMLDEQVQHPDLESDRYALMALKRERGDVDIPPQQPQPSEFDVLIAKLADIYKQVGENGLREMLQQSNVPDAQIDEIITVVVALVANANNQPDNLIQLDMNELVALYQQSEGALRQFLQQKGLPDNIIEQLVKDVVQFISQQGASSTLPFETIQQWVSNTYAVMKHIPEQLSEWREQLEGAKSQMSGMGDDWQNEAQFVDALLAVLRGEKPSLPESHPYHEPVRQLVEALG